MNLWFSQSGFFLRWTAFLPYVDSKDLYEGRLTHCEGKSWPATRRAKGREADRKNQENSGEEAARGHERSRCSDRAGRYRESLIHFSGGRDTGPAPSNRPPRGCRFDSPGVFHEVFCQAQEANLRSAGSGMRNSVNFGGGY